MKNLLIAGCAVLTLTGCNWVQLTDAGKTVSLSSAAAVASCTRVGRAHVQTLSKVTIVERGGEKMQEELLVLARNEAGDLGGNTIVPESVISDGQQNFGVYRCP